MRRRFASRDGEWAAMRANLTDASGRTLVEVYSSSPDLIIDALAHGLAEVVATGVQAPWNEFRIRIDGPGTQVNLVPTGPALADFARSFQAWAAAWRQTLGSVPGG